jgi:DNA repair exonuclease SbcCD ATPase subunit
MEKIDFDKLRKMPPEQKVKALKELQEKLGDLIRERSKEIANSEQEIKDAQDFLKEAEDELRVLEQMEDQAPGIKQVNVEKLFESEKQQREQPTKPQGRELEDIAGEARTTAPSSVDDRAYINTLSRQPVANIYERITQIRDDIRTTGVISSYQQEKLEQFREALHEKEEAAREGAYKPGRKNAALMTAAERAIDYVSGTGGPHYHSR